MFNTPAKLRFTLLCLSVERLIEHLPLETSPETITTAAASRKMPVRRMIDPSVFVFDINIGLEKTENNTIPRKWKGFAWVAPMRHFDILIMVASRESRWEAPVINVVGVHGSSRAPPALAATGRPPRRNRILESPISTIRRVRRRIERRRVSRSWLRSVYPRGVDGSLGSPTS